MNESKRQFIEKMGISFERSGSSPMLGRVYGALLVAGAGHLSAEELGTQLQVSRGAISQATRQLIDLLHIERFRKPGDRKDYFRIASEGLLQASQLRIEEARRMKILFREGIAAMEGASPESTRHLVESIEFMDAMESTIAEFLEDWQQRKEDQRAKRNPDN